MCGIAGILNLVEDASPEEHVLRSMLGTLRHRGPDQFGIYRDANVGLGSARLSIVDLGGGQQPISNEDARYWVVFNGEIFNHLELRAELEAKGHRFATHCDTEIIVHAFEEEGPACVARFNGQFAIALWDRRDRRLFLARDRVGVRPLFFTQTGRALVFGSEIKALLTAPGVRADLDAIAMEEVFTYWAPQAPRTCFLGIRELPPGHYLLAQRGEASVHRYWTPGFPIPRPGAPAPDLDASIEELGALLTDATRLRLRADVPVGAYLSGGLDSSLIAAIVRRLSVSHLDTFSIAFSDSRYDESPFQRQMAEFLGTDHQVIHATHDDIGRVFPEVVWHTETPLVRTAPAPMFLLSRLVRDQRYKVVLTGEGADEFLAGYDIFKEAKIRRFWAAQPESRRRPELLRRLYPDIRELSATGTSYLSAFFGSGLREVDSPAYTHAIRWRNCRRNLRFFSEGFRDRLGGVQRTDPPVELPEAWHAWDTVQRAQFLEITTFLSPYLLASQGDRVAMAHSVEGRYPFLDVRVMEFCQKLPSRYKLRALSEKDILRRLARRWLPPEILARGKRPYRAPIHRAFLGDGAPEYVGELLSEGALQSTAIFHPPAVAALVSKLRQPRQASEVDEMALVGTLSTQLWCRQFLQDRPPIAPLTDRDDVKVIDETETAN